MNEIQIYNEMQPGLERAPDFDIQHHFKGFGIHPSECNIKIWIFGMKAFVLFTDIGKGTSVTNAAEDLVEWVYFHLLYRLDKKDCLFAETYEGKKEAIDLVLPKWDKDRVLDVDWKHLGIKID